MVATVYGSNLWTIKLKEVVKINSVDLPKNSNKVRFKVK